MRALVHYFIAACAIAAADSTRASPTWTFEVLIGDAYNFDSGTRVAHESLGRARFAGEYKTRGLEGPLHYAWRIAHWQDDRAWELQLLHHKLYLLDPDPPIESLSVSHGFNILTINRAMKLGSWRMRVGLGPVITHAEARVAGTDYNGPYAFAGAAVLIGAGREVSITERLYVLAELSASYGYIDAEPTGTPRLQFSIRNPALHAQIGLGYRF